MNLIIHWTFPTLFSTWLIIAEKSYVILTDFLCRYQQNAKAMVLVTKFNILVSVFILFSVWKEPNRY